MIGIHEPHLIKKDLEYIKSAIKSGWVSTSGNLINQFEKKLSNFLKIKYVLCTNSGTSALSLAIKILKPRKNEEVIISTINFISPVNSILYNNCNPIFLDCDDSLNLDQDKVIDFLKKKTFSKRKGDKIITYNKRSQKKIIAIIVTHVFGNPARIDRLVKFCKNKNIKIIEDCAESIGSKFNYNKFKKKLTGTVGDISCFSFNGNKIITSGSGGALCTNNKALYNYSRFLSDQSKTDRINFIHNELGYNYKMSNLQAALGLAQFKRLNLFLKKKKKILEWYTKYLNKDKFALLNKKNSSGNNWLFVIEMKILKKNFKNIYNFFYKNKIQLRPVWFPNHMQKFLKKYEKYNIKNAYMFKKYLCLPSSTFLKEQDIKKISNLLNFYL